MIGKYYRYNIKTFRILTDENDLLTVHNFVRNVLKTHATKLLKQLKDALAAIPEPSEQRTGMSFSTSGLTLEETDPRQDSQGALQPGEDAVFQKPQRPASALQIDKLLQQLEQQRKDSKEKEERMDRQMEQQRKDSRRRKRRWSGRWNSKRSRWSDRWNSKRRSYHY